MAHERLQKILSVRGICSRRKAEEYIQRGLVKVNGTTAILGQKADPTIDRVEVDGKVLEERREMLYYIMHKPAGVVTSNTSSFTDLLVSSNKRINEKTNKRAPTVCDLLPKNLRGKIYPVGRLDKDSSGLLLFTNDGALAYRLTHPKFDHEKEYQVETVEPIFDGALRKLERGVKIAGVLTKPARVRRINDRMFRIALTEGRNRQIRRMVQKVGSTVKSLTRVRIVTLCDETLRPGVVRKLTPEKRSDLLRSVGL